MVARKARPKASEHTGASPRLLLISASDYQSAVTKGVVPLLAEFDEGGYFGRVLIAFPFARTSCAVGVSQRVVVRDLGTDWVPAAVRFRTVRRLAAPAHIVRTIALLVTAVRQDDLHIVRATDPCFAGLVGWATARLTRRPLCVSVHADWDKRHQLGGRASGGTIFGLRAPAKVIERFVLRRADMVMPIRESLRTYVAAAGVPAERIRVIPHGTDLDPFVAPSSLNVAETFGLSSCTKLVSFVGRLVRENYVDDLLDMARRLAERRRDWTLLIVGGGPEEPRLRDRVRNDAVLATVVRFLGFQPRATVAAIRQSSAVSVCLMGGYSLIEACAAGSAVVAYDVEWHGELIRNGETGFLIGEHDVPRLHEVVARLLDDPGLRQSIGKAARAAAVAKHSLETSAAIKRRCYEELLSKSPPYTGSA